jgi:hypothetical protein
MGKCWRPTDVAFVTGAVVTLFETAVRQTTHVLEFAGLPGHRERKMSWWYQSE